MGENMLFLTNRETKRNELNCHLEIQNTTKRASFTVAVVIVMKDFPNPAVILSHCLSYYI